MSSKFIYRTKKEKEKEKELTHKLTLTIEYFYVQHLLDSIHRHHQVHGHGHGGYGGGFAERMAYGWRKRRSLVDAIKSAAGIKLSDEESNSSPDKKE